MSTLVNPNSVRASLIPSILEDEKEFEHNPLPDIDLAVYVPAWQLEESKRLAADARQGLDHGDVSSDKELPL